MSVRRNVFFFSIALCLAVLAFMFTGYAAAMRNTYNQVGHSAMGALSGVNELNSIEGSATAQEASKLNPAATFEATFNFEPEWAEDVELLIRSHFLESLSYYAKPRATLLYYEPNQQRGYCFGENDLYEAASTVKVAVALKGIATMSASSTPRSLICCLFTPNKWPSRIALSPSSPG